MKVHLFLASCVAAVCAAACSRGGTGERIAVFTKNQTNPYFQMVRLGADNAARQMKVRVVHYVPTTADSIPTGGPASAPSGGETPDPDSSGGILSPAPAAAKPMFEMVAVLSADSISERVIDGQRESSHVALARFVALHERSPLIAPTLAPTAATPNPTYAIGETPGGADRAAARRETPTRPSVAS